MFAHGSESPFCEEGQTRRREELGPQPPASTTHQTFAWTRLCTAPAPTFGTPDVVEQRWVIATVPRQNSWSPEDITNGCFTWGRFRVVYYGDMVSEIICDVSEFLSPYVPGQDEPPERFSWKIWQGCAKWQPHLTHTCCHWWLIAVRLMWGLHLLFWASVFSCTVMAQSSSGHLLSLRLEATKLTPNGIQSVLWVSFYSPSICPSCAQSLASGCHSQWPASVPCWCESCWSPRWFENLNTF